jgi:hypothetical protein
VELWVFRVVRLDWYEWNWGQETCKIHSYESKWGRIRPTKVGLANPFRDLLILEWGYMMKKIYFLTQNVLKSGSVTTFLKKKKLEGFTI